MHDPKPPISEARKAIGQRLAEERVGLRMSQDDLASAVGKARRSVAAWEAGESMPNADDLAVLDQRGLDVLYVVTGKRGAVLTPDQQLLVSYTKALPPPAMEATLLQVKTLGAYASRPVGRLVDERGMFTEVQQSAVSVPDAATMTFNGDVHQAFGRDLVAETNIIQPVKKNAARAPRRPRD